MRINFIIGILLLAVTVGCKPTEKGYKQAYDAAKAKREYVDPDAELLTGGHKLLNENSTNWVVLGKDTLQLQHFYLKPENGQPWPQAGPYRLAVAMFKMNTNSTSMLKDIKKGNLKPVIATDGKERHFIIAGSATTADSLKYVLDAFNKANPGFRYIGMTPEQPLIVVSR
ncbi:MAG: hypothetical protein NC095_01830 [Muribaculum sp.]|nr:hypothetical protein [Muribaculum sp.]